MEEEEEEKVLMANLTNILTYQMLLNIEMSLISLGGRCVHIIHVDFQLLLLLIPGVEQNGRCRGTSSPVGAISGCTLESLKSHLINQPIPPPSFCRGLEAFSSEGR